MPFHSCTKDQSTPPILTCKVHVFSILSISNCLTFFFCYVQGICTGLSTQDWKDSAKKRRSLQRFTVWIRVGSCGSTCQLVTCQNQSGWLCLMPQDVEAQRFFSIWWRLNFLMTVGYYFIKCTKSLPEIMKFSWSLPHASLMRGALLLKLIGRPIRLHGPYLQRM